jgi:hypothetical protein
VTPLDRLLIAHIAALRSAPDWPRCHLYEYHVNATYADYRAGGGNDAHHTARFAHLRAVWQRWERRRFP